MVQVDGNQRSEQERGQHDEAEPPCIRKPSDSDRNRKQRGGENRSRHIAHVQAHRIDGRRLRTEVVVPDPDRIRECLAGDGVDICEGRSPRHQGDHRVCEETRLRANRGNVPGPNQLEYHRQRCDRNRQAQNRTRANQSNTENGRDQRARLRSRNLAPPQQVREQLSRRAESDCSSQHLDRGQLEDDEPRDHGRSQCDPHGQVIWK